MPPSRLSAQAVACGETTHRGSGIAEAQRSSVSRCTSRSDRATSQMGQFGSGPWSSFSGCWSTRQPHHTAKSRKPTWCADKSLPMKKSTAPALFSLGQCSPHRLQGPRCSPPHRSHCAAYILKATSSIPPRWRCISLSQLMRDEKC